jgi:uncharacterized protein (TIGR03435 family)
LFRITTAAFSIVFACAAFAQTSDPNLTFDVATIKVAPPPTPVDGKMMVRVGPHGGPGSNDPGRITYSFMNLHQLIVSAWGVKNYQVTGPAAIEGDRYDITAKVPNGASKDDIKVMLQNLLKERLGLKVHREQKVMAVYALVVGKNGPKLTESEDQSDPRAASPTPLADGGPAATAGPPALPDPGRMKMGPDGMPAGPMLRPGGIGVMMRPGPAGMRMKLIGKQVLLSQLVDNLGGQLDRPCLDMTGLTKRYDITLDFAPDMGAMQAKGGMMMMGPGPMGGAPGAGPGGEGKQSEDPSADSATLFTALQEQLGLKLEQRKAPSELIVVDGVNKKPKEN